MRERDGRETLWMTQQAPEFGEQLAHEDLAAVLGLPADRLDHDWPVEIVSTGLATIVVPVADRDALGAIDLDRDAYDAVTGDRDAQNVWRTRSRGATTTTSLSACSHRSTTYWRTPRLAPRTAVWPRISPDTRCSAALPSRPVSSRATRWGDRRCCISRLTAAARISASESAAASSPSLVATCSKWP